MISMTNVIEQKISNNEKSICGKCSHRRVCRAVGNQPCFECNQFAEEIILCKDCTHFEIKRDRCECRLSLATVKPSDFCSHGQRKVANLEDVFDIEAQTKANNDAMRNVINFIVE